MAATDIRPPRPPGDGRATGGVLMRVFVTGASGWIGSAVVPELIGAGHQVVGLARSDASAAALSAAGVEVETGTLDDLDTLARAAAESDGVIHLAFKHDIAFTGDFQGAADADRLAVETFGEALAGSIARSSSPPGCSASRRGGWPPKPTGTARTRPSPRPARVRRPVWPPPSSWSAWRPATSARRSCASPRPSTATGTPASSPRWSGWPASTACRATSATGPTAGPRPTGSIRPTCSDWPSSRHRRVRPCTPSPTKACRSATSPR